MVVQHSTTDKKRIMRVFPVGCDIQWTFAMAMDNEADCNFASSILCPLFQHSHLRRSCLKSSIDTDFMKREVSKETFSNNFPVRCICRYKTVSM